MSDLDALLARFKTMEAEIGTTERAWVLGTYGAAQTFFTVGDVLDEVYEMTSGIAAELASLRERHTTALAIITREVAAILPPGDNTGTNLLNEGYRTALLDVRAVLDEATPETT